MFFVVFFGVSSIAYAYEEGDFQIWHTENQDIDISKKQGSKFTLEEEFRYGGDARQFYYQHYDAGLAFDLNKNLSVSANYRQIWELKKEEFKPEYRPHVNVTAKADLWGFGLEDRNRFEYRIFDYQGAFVQYRNKATVKLPWKFTKFEIRPYFSDEVFVDVSDAYFSRNRFYSGLAFSIAKYLKGEVYYLFQSTKGAGGWKDANVLGLRLRAAF